MNDDYSDDEIDLHALDNTDDEQETDFGWDIVPSNGGGASIIWLHGPSGCGKSITAKAVAEVLKKPLCIVRAGDLGITALEVEKSLGWILELCETWGALVLLQQADVFVEGPRANNGYGENIERKSFVCVLLRLMENFSGCLFVSSNNASISSSNIDPTIASLISVMVEYPPLDEAGRSKVWKNLLELVPMQPEGASDTALTVVFSGPHCLVHVFVDFFLLLLASPRPALFVSLVSSFFLLPAYTRVYSCLLAHPTIIHAAS